MMQEDRLSKHASGAGHAGAVLGLEVVSAPQGIWVRLVARGRRVRRRLTFPADAMGWAALRVFCTSLPCAIRIAVAGVGALELALALCRQSAHRVVIVARPGMDVLRVVRKTSPPR